MPVQLSKVPVDMRRKAAQHLESIRATPMAPRSATARLSDAAWPIHRPDLDEVAYWEFAVELGAGSGPLMTSAAELSALLAAERKSASSRARRVDVSLVDVRVSRPPARGFIIVSTGSHDFPIPHWSLDRAPISDQLGAVAGKARNAGDEGGGIERIYRLDALSYVAESKDGALVGRVGQVPGLVAGLPHDLRRSARGMSTLDAVPVDPDIGDDEADGIEHRVKRTDDRVPELKPVDVDDWPAYRERYADAFGPFLDDLRRQASKAWEVEGLIAEFGEGIRDGETMRVALLDRDAVVELSGDGSKQVEARLDEGSGSPALVLSLPKSAEVIGELDLFVDIHYPDGADERLRFFLVSSSSPSNSRTDPSEGGR